MRMLLLYVGFLVATLIFLILVKVFNISYPLSITTTQSSGELAVTGIGKADVVPDQGTVTASIQVDNASTQQDAQQQMNKINDAIITAVQNVGIAKKDIQTTAYQINPSYDYSSGSQKANGFSGTAEVTITVHDFSKISQVTDAVTAAGATNVNSENSGISNPEKYQEIARQNAINDAKTQAKKLADQLGIHLGKIDNFVEGSNNVPVPMYNSMSLPRTGGGMAVPQTTIEPGTQTVTSTVTLYFERN